MKSSQGFVKEIIETISIIHFNIFVKNKCSSLSYYDSLTRQKAPQGQRKRDFFHGL